MKLQKLIKKLRRADHRTAVSALSSIEEKISPQGAAFSEEAVMAIPLLFDIATRSETKARREILNYLGSAYEDTLGTWQFRWDEDPETRHYFTEMVAWEQAISETYRSCMPSVIHLLGRDNDESVRGSSVFLLSRIKECPNNLTLTFRNMYAEQAGDAFRIDIIEGMTNLIFRQNPVPAAELHWLHEKLKDPSPAIRMGTALSLMAREGQQKEVESDEPGNRSLNQIALDARGKGEHTLRKTAWLAKKSTDWALERAFVQTADSGDTKP
ncbi:hypothetical protein ACFVWY_02190 [Streptomyces sp. NPDC058195]|uniref:hypothetical protein n=1 Tax=Streptomyces sp. NPDC058195 TaxID=3346375 RepID=UPI0036E8AC45